MILEAPKRLPEESFIDGFTSDPSLSWVAAYAGPCGDPECKEPHTRLYLIPVIGWLQVRIPIEGNDEMDELFVRPAIMSANGSVSDYLDIPPEFTFIATVVASDDAVPLARKIYQARFGDRELVTEGKASSALPN